MKLLRRDRTNNKSELNLVSERDKRDTCSQPRLRVIRPAVGGE